MTFSAAERTGPSIYAALDEHAPDRRAEFEAEFHDALAETDEDFDLGRVQAVIDKWWPIVHSVLHPQAEEEHLLITRFQSDDDTDPELSEPTSADYAAMAQSYEYEPPRRDEMVGEPYVAPDPSRRQASQVGRPQVCRPPH